MAGVFQIVNALSSMVVNDVTPISMTSQTECAYKCYYGNSCLSFFHTPDGRCYLLDKILESTEPGLTQSPSTQYFKANIVNCSGDAGYKYVPSIPLCYKLSTESLSWSSAKSRCESDGGRLFQIDTAHKITWAFHNIKVTGGVWIGGEDTDVEGEWKWADDTPVVDPLWRDGEPSNTFNQDCLLIGNDGLWDDSWCATSYLFLCEIQTTSCL
ncbi:perlucin-like protein [Haliotis rubra]|uniref:perlucin-like protein n=1 Tax=Haliotis rubra TaxID=36100 RepID=UPI001EE50C5D|nr:perlucin-like protein [Haliotis rubra]